MALLPALAMAVLGLNPVQAHESPLLAMFDANHNGKVSLSEYLAYMDRGFTRMDRNGDHILEANEFPSGTRRKGPLTLKQHHRHVTTQFRRQDRNHDGWLSLRELMAPPR